MAAPKKQLAGAPVVSDTPQRGPGVGGHAVRVEHAGGVPDPPPLRLWLLLQPAAVRVFPHRLSLGTG